MRIWRKTRRGSEITERIIKNMKENEEEDAKREEDKK
jgi:hypothetical protein